MDGVSHINCYSRGRTELGRALSNFAHTPFTLEGDGNFASVEGWWYWRRTNNEKLRTLHGHPAKLFGQGLQVREDVPEAPTKAELKAVYRAKLDFNPELRDKVLNCIIPFDHYYEYEGKRRETRWRWTGQLWNEVRADILKELHK